MTTHRQTTTGFDEKDRHIVLRIMRGIEDTSAHHVVPARLEHQSLADPIVFLQKMLALLAHIAPVEDGAAAGYQPHGIATGMGNNAKKGLFHCLDPLLC